jgi:hypothetical protein
MVMAIDPHCWARTCKRKVRCLILQVINRIAVHIPPLWRSRSWSSIWRQSFTA